MQLEHYHSPSGQAAAPRTRGGDCGNLSTVRKGEREVKNSTVRLVIDEPQDLEVYGTFFRDSGYETLMRNSAGEGIIFLEAESISLVIVSQGTPAFKGRQVLEWCRELHTKVPVLVIARALDMHYYLEAMDLGAIDYLERLEPKDMAWVVEAQILRCAFA
jgi:DNA-binding NtrC family response regulator